jgi:CubicO group peptidase (beta-lactamase class C family)
VSEQTVYDLASLTKPIVSASLAMRLIETGALALADKVQRWVPSWTGPDRTPVTIRDLLEHCSGLTAWLPFYRDHQGRADFEHAIARLPLEYAAWSQSVYSDLGFMLLGFVLESAGTAPLDRQFRALAGDLELTFLPPRQWQARTAATEVDAWRGRLLIGEVHDENAWALDGVAGHAGLFGTAPAVGGFARLVMATMTRETRLGRPDTLARFLTRSTVPASSRALGWDTMRPTSSCGRYMSTEAFGHTGFTGTSVWIDPVRDRYVVFLTNRVHPTRANEGFARVRPALHDAVMGEG